MFLQTETIIEFLKFIDLDVNVTETTVTAENTNIWQATASISKNKIILTEGISLGRGNRLFASCIAILEAFERLVFKFPELVSRPTGNSNWVVEGFHEKHLFYYNPINSSFEHGSIKKPTWYQPFNEGTSIGWALGGSIEEACGRAKNEIVERKITETLPTFFGVLELVPLKGSEMAIALRKIAQNDNVELTSTGIHMEGKMSYGMVTLFDKVSKKLFFGTSLINESMDFAIEKALEEVLSEYHFSVIAGNDNIGSPPYDINYNLYSTFVHMKRAQNKSGNRPSLPLTDFAFNVFSVKNKNVSGSEVFVVQGLVGDSEKNACNRLRK